MSVPNTTATGAAVNNTNKKVIVKNCAAITDRICEVKKIYKQIIPPKIDIEMPLYNLIEYSNAYPKTSGSLQEYYRGESALNDNNEIIGFPANNNRASFKFKLK